MRKNLFAKRSERPSAGGGRSAGTAAYTTVCEGEEARSARMRAAPRNARAERGPESTARPRITHAQQILR